MADAGVEKGADEFLRLSKALKAAGKTGLRKELNKGLRDAAKPIIPKTRKAALAKLPSRGGLAKAVAKTPQRVQVRTGASTAGVRIVVGKTGSGARGANRGTVRHPVFGDREKWVDQKVPAGWFDDTVKDSAPEIRAGLEKVIERVAQQVIHDARG